MRRGSLRHRFAYYVPLSYDDGNEVDKWTLLGKPCGSIAVKEATESVGNDRQLVELVEFTIPYNRSIEFNHIDSVIIYRDVEYDVTGVRNVGYLDRELKITATRYEGLKRVGFTSLLNDRWYYLPDGVDDVIFLPATVKLPVGSALEFTFRSPSPSENIPNKAHFFGGDIYFRTRNDANIEFANTRLDVYFNGTQVFNNTKVVPRTGDDVNVRVVVKEATNIVSILGRHDNQGFMTLPVWNFRIIDSEVGTLFYPLDDGNTVNDTIRESLQAYNARLYNGQPSSWFKVE